jgi:hypothetical protein
VAEEVAGHVLLVVGVPGHPLAVGHDGRQVGYGRGTLEAECGPRGPVARQAGRACEGAHRCRSAVEAGAADLGCFEQGDLRAEFAGLEGGGYARWSSPEHQQADLAHHLMMYQVRRGMAITKSDFIPWKPVYQQFAIRTPSCNALST